MISDRTVLMAGVAAAGMRLFFSQRQDLSCILNHIVKSRHFDLFISLSQSIFWGGGGGGGGGGMDQITRAILGLKKLQWLLKADSFGQPEAIRLFLFFWQKGGGGGGGDGGGITSSRNNLASVFHLFLNFSLCDTVSFSFIFFFTQQ